MIVQTENSTYIVEWMAPPAGTTQRWGVYRYPKAPASQVRNYARNLSEAPFEGDTLTLGIGSRMILSRTGKPTPIIDSSIVEKIER